MICVAVVNWTFCPLYSLCFFVNPRVCLAAIVVTLALVSRKLALHRLSLQLSSAFRRWILTRRLLATLNLWLSYSTFFGYETIFDYLIDVFLLPKSSFEIEASHMLANIGLVDALGMAMLISWIECVRMP